MKLYKNTDKSDIYIYKNTYTHKCQQFSHNDEDDEVVSCLVIWQSVYAKDGPSSSVICLFKDCDFPCTEGKPQNQKPMAPDAKLPPLHQEKEEEANVPVDGYTEKWPDLCDPDKE